MPGIATISFVAGSAIVSLACASAIFISSGIYNIGADDHHTSIVQAIIEQLRERSIEVHARSLDVPNLEDPSRIVSGAEHYAALCVTCHLAPGVSRSDLRAGLYPLPPNLVQKDSRDAREAFWTIKHGIKMSAMPAWGTTLSDEEIWDIVSFVRKVPAMTPETYRQLARPLQML